MQIWDVRDIHDDDALHERLAAAASALMRGGLVAFPTETVYGLGADATNEEAVRGVFRAKQRPADNPLIVHIAAVEMLPSVVAAESLPAPVWRAIRAFWPGPLTLILPAHPSIAAAVRPGMDTVGVRLPDHPVARALIRTAQRPIAAPSANRSGRPSPTTAADVVEDLAGRIDGVVDGGPCRVGVESTVAAISADEAVIYRPGAVTLQELAAVTGIPVRFDAHLLSPAEAPKSPGMKYRHYAPDAAVHVWWGDEARVAAAIGDFLALHAGDPVAVMLPASLRALADAAKAAWVADPHEPYAAALSRDLYGELRRFDRLGMRYIAVAGVPAEGLGIAVMNRLQKAAEGRVYRA